MDDDAFSQVVEQYTDHAYNLAYRILHDPADADDVVQDAFLSAYRARDRFRGDAEVTTWLHRIVVNAALQRIRRERRPREMAQSGVEEIEVPDWTPGPEESTLNSELRDKLEEALASLPDDMRAAVVLRDVEQLSAAEAAAVVGVSVSALKARLHRGRVALRDHLSRYVSLPG